MCVLNEKRKNNGETRGTSSKKTPVTQSRKPTAQPSSSPPTSVSTMPPPAPAPATFVGRTTKSKVRKRVISLSLYTEHPMVFPDISADIVDDAPPSEVVVPSRAKNQSTFLIELSLAAREKSKSVSSSSKAAAVGLLKLPMKLSRSKKNTLAPKRKLVLGSSSPPLTAAKNRLKAHPPSSSSSESEPEEEKYESEEVHDITISDESVPDNAESEAESGEPEQEDIVPTEEEDESDIDPVATPLSSKAKGKRPISNSATSQGLSGVNFKPHSPTFCYNDNTRDMVLYSQRKILIEKNYVLSDHCPYVYVRGHWFSFSPQDIAKALHLPLDVEDDDDLDSLDKDEVITELVGQKMVWPPNTVISVTNLTYTYAVLHKFATMNWKPTSHTATISFDMASFLYKVGTRIGVDLAMFIYDQIIGFRKDLKRDQEDLVAPTTATSYKASAPTTEAADAPSSKKAKPQSLNFSPDDIHPESSSVPIDSGTVAAELAAVRASLDSLIAQVMTFEGLQHSVFDAIKALSKDLAV
ncbi:uncharacterized protein LOC133785580 [Humulus lupulus]|uniref:uncharacterized protein LOC133785580 n=1 Tax=Humulus lupulus TaxID=3486 RepID=UPI002B40D07A|nr:uncharacterized protein LOC133785580 [Humulus lupulus]